MKKIAAAVLLAALITVYVPVTSAAAEFSDVPPEHWAYSVISAMTDSGIFTGFPDGTFRPSDIVTRAQWAKIMILTAELEIDESAPTTHDDVPFSHWARPYIEAAKSYLTSLEIDGKTVYQPDLGVTRADAAAAVARLLNLQDNEPDYTLIDTLNDYDLIMTLDDSIISSIAASIENGLLKGGADGYFRPNDVLSRAEAATIMHRTTLWIADNLAEEPEQLAILLDIQSAVLSEGKTLQLGAKIVPENVDAPALIFTSGDTEIALVDETGIITAISKGNTIITVSTADGKLKAEFSLSVIKPDTDKSLWLDKTSISLTEGEMTSLEVGILPEGSDFPELMWKSSNTDIAYVNNAGRVAALSEGTAVITVSTADGSLSAQCFVTVTRYTPAPNDSFTLRAERTDVFVGEQISLRWNVPQSMSHHVIVLYISVSGGDFFRFTQVFSNESEFTPTVTFEGTFAYKAEITTENGTTIESNIVTVTVRPEPPVQYNFNIFMNSYFTIEDGVSWQFSAIDGAVSYSVEVYYTNTNVLAATMITTPFPMVNRFNGFPAGEYVLYITAHFPDDSSGTSLPMYFSIGD